MARIYLDYAATTPLDPAVMRVMTPYFSEKFGNPGSLHAFGQEAIAEVDKAREMIAKNIGCPAAAGFREVVFTGSATEANNLALRGTLKGFRVWGLGSSGKERKKRSTLYPNPYTLRPRVIISAVEHESVRETAHDLEKEGVEVVEIPVSCEGVVDLQKLRASLNERTVLVSVMYANNEIGTVQPISEIAKVIQGFRVSGVGSRGKSLNPDPYSSLYPLFHADAAQAFQFLDCNVEKLGVDMMTLSAHKLYGPKGIGALYMRHATRGTRQGGRRSISHVAFPMSPILTGGGQEFGLRSGTENMPGIVGFAEAVELAARMRVQEAKRVGELREMLWQGIRKVCPRSEVNGVHNYQLPITNYQKTLPNILNIYFPGHSAEELLMKLDRAGLAASAGPACSSRSAAPSRIVRALGYSLKRAGESVRFSMGKYTTREEIRRAICNIEEAV